MKKMTHQKQYTQMNHLVSQCIALKTSSTNQAQTVIKQDKFLKISTIHQLNYKIINGLQTNNQSQTKKLPTTKNHETINFNNKTTEYTLINQGNLNMLIRQTPATSTDEIQLEEIIKKLCSKLPPKYLIQKIENYRTNNLNKIFN